jgi:hypothetical protein
LENAGDLPLSRVALESASLKISIEHPAASALLHARIENAGQPPRESSFSAGPLDTPALVALEMVPGSRHAVYQKSLSLAQAIPESAIFSN